MRRLRIAIGIGVGALSFASRSAASETCRAEIEGRAPRAWETARAELEASARNGDCAQLVLRFGPDEEARLIIRTRDGRQAERALRDPDELGPTTTALLITTEAAAEGDETPPPPPSSPAPSPDHTPPPDRVPARIAPRETLIFGLQGGARGGAGNLVSPVMTAFASLDIARWEVGILGTADFGYSVVQDERRRASSTSVGAGVLLGRRARAGPVDLFAGGRTILALVTGRSVATTPHSYESEDAIGNGEVRVGAYAGTSFARSWPIRPRADLGFDIVPANAGEDRSLPPLTPWWTASLQVGVELGR